VTTRIRVDQLTQLVGHCDESTDCLQDSNYRLWPTTVKLTGVSPTPPSLDNITSLNRRGEWRGELRETHGGHWKWRPLTKISLRLWTFVYMQTYIYSVWSYRISLRNWPSRNVNGIKGVMTWVKVTSLVCRFWSLPWTNGPNTQFKWKLRYSPIQCAYLEPSMTYFSNRRRTRLGLEIGN